MTVGGKWKQSEGDSYLVLCLFFFFFNTENVFMDSFKIKINSKKKFQKNSIAKRATDSTVFNKRARLSRVSAGA